MLRGYELKNLSMKANTFFEKSQSFLMIIFGLVCVYGCAHEFIDEYQGENGSVKEINLSVNPDLVVDWDNYNHGDPYTVADARNDFGDIDGYTQDEQSRVAISSDHLRVKLLANEHGEAGGVITTMDVPDKGGYELSYRLRFHSAFDWAQNGGRLGFGLLVGDGITGGGEDATLGRGGSFRLGWNKNSSGDVYFHPYVYYKDQPGSGGDDFNSRYPSSGSIQKGVWYNIKLVAKYNNYKNYNGTIQMYVNNTLVYENTSFRWTSDYSKRLFNKIIFSNYRAGSDSESSSYGYIYFDDFKLKDLSDPNLEYYEYGSNKDYNYQKFTDSQTGVDYFLTTIKHQDQNGQLIPLELAQATIDSGESVSGVAYRLGSTIAFNAGTENGSFTPIRPTGTVIINGTEIKNDTSWPRYILGIKSDNTLKAYDPGTTTASLLNDGVKHAVTAFTPLIENSQALNLPEFSTQDVFTKRAQRQIIGQYPNKDLLLLTSYGREASGSGAGFNVDDVIRIMEDEGVEFAYMLDGGGSTGTVVKDSILTKYNECNFHCERLRPTFLYIKKG